jgi:asparagine synthase (glutamine-hydrolysing)
MGAAMDYWGPDGGMAVDGVSALGCRRSHDEEAGDGAVIALADGGVLVATARLDNGEDLQARLGLRGAVGDRRLVAAAWDRWGEHACEQLYGDWSFAVWQPRQRRLVLARDHFGNTALYYHRGPRSVLFGSSRKALFALPETPRRLNELRLAQHLVFWVTDGGATLHEEIHRLPPGHRLTATDSALRVSRYWYPEELAELRLGDDGAYADAFLERYDQAVRARLRTPRRVATTLSSGLDSGSVTALAARAVASRPGALTAFTAVPRFPAIAELMPRIRVDEWPLAQAVAAHCGIDDHRRLTAASTTSLAAFERSLFLHDEPEYAAANLHWIIGLLEEARSAGAGVLLTGQLGNAGVSWTGDQQRVFRSFLAGRWLDAWVGLRRSQARTGKSLPRALVVQLLRPLVARARAHAFRRGWSDEFQISLDLIAPAFARRIGIVERVRAADYDCRWTNPREPLAQRLGILLPDINPIGALWHEAGAGYALDVADPTVDVRLLEFCLSIPDEQFEGGPQDRWLLRRSFEGLLPPAVQWNPRRGRQSADLSLRLRAERDEIGPTVARLAASPAVGEYLDVPALRRRWAHVERGTDAEAFAAAPALARTLLFGLFLDGAQ